MTRFRSHLAPSLFSLLAALACAASACRAPDAPGDEAGLVGTYDGRAVVIAYVNGPRFRSWMAELRQQHDAAEAAGDTNRTAELEQQAQQRQERLHVQAFEGGDIDDVLEVIAGELDAVRHQAGVSRLERVNRARDADVVTVDVTDLLVELFEPSEQGRKWIADMRERPFR